MAGVDKTSLEWACRCVCAAHGIDPDRESVGLGILVPLGKRYKLWEAQKKTVKAVFDYLGVEYDCMDRS